MNCRSVDFLIKWMAPEDWPGWLRSRVERHHRVCRRCAAGMEPLTGSLAALLRGELDEAARRHEAHVPLEAARAQIEHRIRRRRHSLAWKLGWRPEAAAGFRMTPALSGAMVLLLVVGTWMLFQHAFRRPDEPMQVVRISRPDATAAGASNEAAPRPMLKTEAEPSIKEKPQPLRDGREEPVLKEMAKMAMVSDPLASPPLKRRPMVKILRATVAGEEAEVTYYDWPEENGVAVWLEPSPREGAQTAVGAPE